MTLQWGSLKLRHNLIVIVVEDEPVVLQLIVVWVMVWFEFIHLIWVSINHKIKQFLSNILFGFKYLKKYQTQY